jgi:hypothetical protein
MEIWTGIYCRKKERAREGIPVYGKDNTSYSNISQTRPIKSQFRGPN